MTTFLKITKKLYCLGLLGLIGTFFHIPELKLFYLFFLLCIVDFVLSFVLVLKTDSENDDENIRNLKFLFQNLGMLLGIPCIYVRNRLRLPNIRNYKPQVLYSLPFEGIWTVANGGIDKKTSHSWSICPQRYAYDFFIEENGQSFRGNGKAVTDYLCYGKPILAPADGVVVELKNQFEDTPVSDNQEVLCSASDVRGNYIVIQHSAQEYSTIAHIKKDSFCVKPGDKVSRGQVIARCGNSGNTSEPHIHFQIQQGKSFLFSAGLPIWFTNLKNHTIPEETVHISRDQLVEKESHNSVEGSYIMDKNEFLDYFQNFSFWKHMSEADKELLLSNIRTLHYEEGAAIQSGEQQCLGTLFLLKGIMRVYLLSSQGKEATLYRLRAGDICTLSASCMLSAITFDVQIDAETDCELLLLPAPVFSRLMKSNIYLESFIYKLTAEHFSDVISGIERTFFLSLPQRIAAFLLDEAAETDSDTLPLTKESLARSIGSAREAVSRALKQMSSEGCIEVSRGSISIKNKSRLYQMLNHS